MSRSEVMNSKETKLDLILKAIESLSMRTNILEDFAATMDSKQQATEASQTGTSATMMPI